MPILANVEKVGTFPFFACESNDLGMLFEVKGKKLNKSKKCRFSKIMLRILVPSMTS